MSDFILPGSWVGILGGGQLGRMLALAARRMGYRVITWTGGGDAGPAAVADEVIDAAFDCEDAMERFCRRANVATVEFENIPQRLLEEIGERIPLRPQSDAVVTGQHREREKTFLRRKGFPCAWHREVGSADSLKLAMRDLPSEDGILKTAEFGYDGKGQRVVRRGENAESLWSEFGAPSAILEERVDLVAELSVLVARSGIESRVFGPTENRHRNHILDVSIFPGRMEKSINNEAIRIAAAVAEELDYIGVLAVEFFVASSGQILVNEIAPRPHNSGHHTIESCVTSQFEQQLRAICGLPLGATDLLRPAVMWNLLGDLWIKSEGEIITPDWGKLLEIEGLALHLYGKSGPQFGRKMGHVTICDESLDLALKKAELAQERFQWCLG